MAEPSGAETPEAKAEVLLARLRFLHQQMQAAVQRARDGETEWEPLTHAIGRNRLPDLLLQVWELLPPGRRIIAIRDAWTLAEYPESRLGGTDRPGRDLWLPMFREAGYHDETQEAQPPDTITLWRGGTVAKRMAWTGKREQAEWFRDRHGPDRPGRLWTATVGAERLLAHYDAPASEDEYVIDPIGLQATEIHEPSRPDTAGSTQADWR